MTEQWTQQEFNPTLLLWDQCETIEQYQALNIAFVSGAIDRSPSHDGPLDPETSIIGDQIIKANKLGCITIDSQPYDDFIAHHRGGIRVRQHPYCFLYYDRNKTDRLIQIMLTKEINRLTGSKIPQLIIHCYDPIIHNVTSFNKDGNWTFDQDFINGRWNLEFGSVSIPDQNYMREYFFGDIRTDKIRSLFANNLKLLMIYDNQNNNNMFNALVEAAYELFLI